MTTTSTWRRWLQAAIGVAISAGFVAITLSRVDFELMADAWGTVRLALLGVAVGIALSEVCVRAVRWRILLRPLTQVGYGTTLGYLSIGHLANAILPARLGDVGRALLAGTRLRISRVSVIGTIAVERVSDASLIGLVAAAGIVVGYREMLPAVLALAIGGVGAVILLAVIVFTLNRQAVVATRIGTSLRRGATPVAAGALALRDPRQAFRVAILTASSFTLAVLVFHIMAAAVGLDLALWQSAFAMAAVTLSTAVPAGPASIGTYEFVGVTVLTSMGIAPEPSLLTVALVHGAVTLTPSVMGLTAMWWLGIRLPATGREQAVHGPSAPERIA